MPALLNESGEEMAPEMLSFQWPFHAEDPGGGHRHGRAKDTQTSNNSEVSCMEAGPLCGHNVTGWKSLINSVLETQAFFASKEGIYKACWELR